MSEYSQALKESAKHLAPPFSDHDSPKEDYKGILLEKLNIEQNHK